jgi:ABC-type proline/glycine betaine transport system substrate-binding protein
MADTITRYKAGKPILYYTWTPYWVSNVLKPGKDVVWLQVPFSACPASRPAPTPSWPMARTTASSPTTSRSWPTRPGPKRTRRRQAV